MSYFLVLFLLLILAALAAAGFFLVRGQSEDDADKSSKPQVSNITKALTIRIGLSVVLFLCILISWKLGWIQPTGIPR